jgi:hypothetical protein
MMGAKDVEEAHQSGNIRARYAQDAGIDEPLAEMRPGVAGCYEQDGLGSVTSLSNTTGSVGLFFSLALQDAVVEALAAAKTLFETVPVFNFLFTELPAQENDLIGHLAGKIQ